jgi:hypothetical protein
MNARILCGSILVLLVSLSGGGCTSTIIPPPATADSISVFVTNYGRHSSLLLRDPAGHYNEYAFGDWNWFGLADTSIPSAVRAMLFSRGSTIGRRQLMLPADIDGVTRATRAAQVIQFDAPRNKVEGLIRKLDQRYQKHIDTITYSPRSSMWFVKDDEYYWALHNCNQITARWLRDLGCRIHGLAIFSRFNVTGPSRLDTANATSE